MLLVWFEVTVKEEGMQEYLSLAAGLKDELLGADGFIRLRAGRFFGVGRPYDSGRFAVS